MRRVALVLAFALIASSATAQLSLYGSDIRHLRGVTQFCLEVDNLAVPIAFEREFREEVAGYMYRRAEILSFDLHPCRVGSGLDREQPRIIVTFSAADGGAGVVALVVTNRREDLSVLHARDFIGYVDLAAFPWSTADDYRSAVLSNMNELFETFVVGWRGIQ